MTNETINGPNNGRNAEDCSNLLDYSFDCFDQEIPEPEWCDSCREYHRSVIVPEVVRANVAEETIELRTTEEGLHWFISVSGHYWAAFNTAKSYGYTSGFEELARTASEAYPAGEPCES